MPRRRGYDHWIFLTTGLLVLSGLFMVGSASHYVAMNAGMSPYHFLLRHALHLLTALVAFAATLSFSYRRLADLRVVALLVGVAIVALVGVLFMPAIGGAHRWYRLGPFALQPSEFAKIAVVIYAALLLSRKEERIDEPKAVLLPLLLVVGTIAALVAIEPDLGSAVMIFATVAILVFVAGIRWRYVACLAGLAAAGFVVAVLAEPYRWERIKTYLRPTADTQGAGFQLAQSLIAVGSGGLTGVGFGQGHQKAFYLPAAHTDFIFSVIGEEIGLLGTATFLVAFLVLFWRGVRAAVRATDRFGFYLALGLTSLIVVQALTHMGVCLGVLPTKGLPMPFVSYGGSSLLATLVATGLLVNVSHHAD